jgi:hypothetical protein
VLEELGCLFGSKVVQEKSKGFFCGSKVAQEKLQELGVSKLNKGCHQ